MSKHFATPKFLDDLFQDMQRQDQLHFPSQSLKPTIPSGLIRIKRGSHWAKIPLLRSRGHCEDCGGEPGKILAFHIVRAMLKHIESTNNNLIELHDTLGSQHTVWLHPRRTMAVDEMIDAAKKEGTYAHFQHTLGLNFLEPCLEVQGNWIIYRRCYSDNATNVNALIAVHHSAC